VAKKLGFDCIGYEIDATYFDIIKQRLNTLNV
jgi:DNA modification methylase